MFQTTRLLVALSTFRRFRRTSYHCRWLRCKRNDKLAIACCRRFTASLCSRLLQTRCFQQWEQTQRSERKIPGSLLQEGEPAKGHGPMGDRKPGPEHFLRCHVGSSKLQAAASQWTRLVGSSCSSFTRVPSLEQVFRAELETGKFQV